MLSKLSLVILFVVGLPLLGVIVAGDPISRYLEFPPVTQYVDHLGFSRHVFFALSLFVCLVIAPFLIKIILTQPTPAPPGRGLGPWAAPTRREGTSRRGTGNFSQPAGSLLASNTEKSSLSPSILLPWWGWLGAVVLAIAWILAWSRFPWFETWQGFTFSPIWLGYIIVINAWTFRRTGHCLMLDRPKYFLWLFPLSAGFWWYFEYLNRFVQNWHYVGIDSFSPLEYFIYATLPFSTVLPAVLSTKEWLESFPRVTLPLRDFWPVRIRHWRLAAVLSFVVGGAGLAGLGIWPDVLFPAVWMSPILIMASLQILFDGRSLFSGLQRGDWRSVWVPALSGLCCGLLWELWNSRSLAHWQYTVPYVQRFSLFEMPLLGYAGYLPFGVECAIIAELFLGRRKP